MKDLERDYIDPKTTQAKRVVERFGFRPLEIHPIKGNKRCFHVKSSNESGENKELFLKQLRQETAAASQKRLIEELEWAGFKLIPQLYRSKEGAFELVDEGSTWTLWQYLESKPQQNWLNFDCSPQQCFQAGQALSLLHGAGQKVLGKKPDFALPTTLSRLESFPVQFEKHLRCYGEPGRSETRAPAISMNPAEPGKLLDRAKNLCKRLMEIERKGSATINHGDFHPSNLIFSSATLEAVVDWDFAVKGQGIFDLCYALFFFCLSPGERELFCKRKTEAFLDGYTRASATVKNMDFLSSYTELVHLLLLDWVLVELCSPDSDYTELPGFDRLVRAIAHCLI